MLLIQESLKLHSSLSLHAMTISCTIGGDGGMTIGGSMGRGVVTEIGDFVVCEGSLRGMTSSSIGTAGSKNVGGSIGMGRSVANAEHLMVGFPVVPGGHLHLLPPHTPLYRLAQGSLISPLEGSKLHLVPFTPKHTNHGELCYFNYYPMQ